MRATALRLVPALAIVALSSAARADDPRATCYVRMIKASNDGSGVDPRITRMREYLEKPPLNAWKKFTLIEEKDLDIAPRSTRQFALPNGRQAALSYVDHMLSEQGKHRLRLHFEIMDGAKKKLDTTFVLDEGGVVLEAGQKLENGLLILGFSCHIPDEPR